MLLRFSVSGTRSVSEGHDLCPTLSLADASASLKAHIRRRFPTKLIPTKLRRDRYSAFCCVCRQLLDGFCE